MKKLLVIIAAALLFSVAASAQPKAAGLRLGYGAELSYQHYLGSNFIEADLGFLGGAGTYVTGIYNFHLGEAGNFNFYAGPGASVGYAVIVRHYDNVTERSRGISAAVAGQVGAAYEFQAIPLDLSIDWRPAYDLGLGFRWQGLALGVRYRF